MILFLGTWSIEHLASSVEIQAAELVWLVRDTMLFHLSNDKIETSDVELCPRSKSTSSGTA